MKIVDIANEIFIETGSPTTTTIPAIAFWVRGHIGWLNTMLYESFAVDPNSLEVFNSDGSEINLNAVAILKQYYYTESLGDQVQSIIQGGLADSVISVADNLAGTSFTRLNRSEMAKTMLAYHKEEHEVLNMMITAYRNGNAMPSQVAGDDTQVGYVEMYPAYRPLLIRRY